LATVALRLAVDPTVVRRKGPACFRQSRRIIIPLTVKEILNEQIAQKLALGTRPL